jgi:F-type H+-transporting ATPase subunit gamma
MLAAMKLVQIMIMSQEEDELLASLLPRIISTQIYSALLESSAAELAARMTAMDNATRNAGDMIDRFDIGV